MGKNYRETVRLNQTSEQEPGVAAVMVPDLGLSQPRVLTWKTLGGLVKTRRLVGPTP